MYQGNKDSPPDNKAVSQELGKKADLKKFMKKTMPFVAFMKERVVTKGLEALDTSLPWDEMAVLQDNLAYITQALDLEVIQLSTTLENLLARTCLISLMTNICFHSYCRELPWPTPQSWERRETTASLGLPSVSSGQSRAWPCRLSTLRLSLDSSRPHCPSCRWGSSWLSTVWCGLHQDHHMHYKRFNWPMVLT